jgi:4'-phosphopantetheinyl transferase EntD
MKSEATIRVFWTRLHPARHQLVGLLQGALPPVLADRLRRYPTPEAQWQSLGGKYLLWHGLRALNRESALAAIAYRPTGQPYDASGQVGFSLSHSGGVVVVAVGLGHVPVGIDVQQVRPFSAAQRGFLALPTYLTTPAECTAAWAKREALYKASQWPWNMVMRQLPVEAQPVIEQDGDTYHLHRIETWPGYATWLAAGTAAISTEYVSAGTLWRLAPAS